ncbi:MAG: quinone oxidoreductase [Alphaproteobacteria bacterium]|nr:quinone oxidoreductase [Alphaproteobacteria bacterium]
MSKAICIHEHGGPEVLRWENVTVAEPGIGEVLLAQKAVGLNFIDIYHRTGLYPITQFPFIPGLEGAGVIEKLGAGVEDFKVGDRVAYVGMPLGAYAERRTVPASLLIPLPEGMTEGHAAGIMLKGLTAYFLTHLTYRVSSIHRVLVHAAAGGVGSILSQWAKLHGATVIGTAGGPEKCAAAKTHGCDHVIDYTKEDFVARVREITGGQGVHVVYDSVGKDTFLKSLDCLERLGMMVSYGQASGKVEPFDVGLLREKGSLFLTRPTLMDYLKYRREYELGAAMLLDLVLSGKLKINIGQGYRLQDAAEAHRDLEARKTFGASILVVE